MGMYYKLLEYEKDLHIWIKELERNRIDNDLLNHDKCKPLYDVYHEVCSEINKLRQLIK